ncbi:MAG TPA: hypothetical protein VK889_09120 [Solirubrobacterales bacterium]|nr:hypothetical protein [Solirubrobacterales bacterium]
MHRGKITALAASAFACYCGLLPTAASAQGLVFGSFEAKGDDGYLFEVSTLRRGVQPVEVSVGVGRGALGASYETRGLDDPGIHAEFGDLGHADLDFQRRKRTVEHPEKGCTIITETGAFTGSFAFIGESDYASLKRSRANGIVLRLPNGFCGFPDDRPSALPPLWVPTAHLTAKARVPHGFVEFGAMVASDGPRSPVGERPSFYANLHERIGNLKITRSVSAGGSPQSFVLADGRRPRSATVAPAPPFSGSADFSQPAAGAATWTGTLGAPFLGAGPFALAGETFAVRLCPRIELLASCDVALSSR